MDPFMASLLASVASGGLSGLLSGAGKGSSGSTGYDVLNFNDPYDANSRSMSSAYMQDVLSALRAGKTPDWLNRYTDSAQADLLRQNKNQFFGKEGAPGGSVMDIAQSTGAMSGLGGAAGQAPVNKALSDYADRMSGINQYIAGLKNNYMTSASQTAPQQLYDMGQRSNQVVGGMGAPASKGNNSPFANMASSLGSVDWSKLFSAGSTTSSSSSINPAALVAFGGGTGQYVPAQRDYSNLTLSNY